MKMKFLCCRYEIVYICEQVKINGKVLNHQQTVLNCIEQIMFLCV